VYIRVDPNVREKEVYSMKNTALLLVFALLFIGATAYAHHPAEDNVDPDVYEMIEENISEVHLNMTFDDMGGDTSDVGSAMEAQDSDVGAAMGGDMEDVGSAMEERTEMNAMADAEPEGPMK
jgi:hypothetical protein